MNTLFGVSLPTPVNFVIAFVVVLALIGAATWLVRRFGTTRLDASARGRQPRLAVIDSATVDARRKLIIIRRDNVEHLLMIGGPSDVVVETNIVRAAAATTTREPGVVRNGEAETILRAVPSPEPASWSQPEPAPAPATAHNLRADRGPRVTTHASPLSPAHSEPAAVPAQPARAAQSADSLASLAAELSSLKAESTAAARVSHTEPAQAPAPHAPALAPSAPPTAPATDHSITEMAHRLEAALRRPTAQKVEAEGGTARAAIAPEAKPARDPNAAAAPSKVSAKPQPNNLEQELANLLTQPGKT